MRILLTAFALTFALPAAAQTAPAQPAPAQPAQPSGNSAAHGQHGQHAQHAQHHDGQHHDGQHHDGQHHGQHHAQPHGQGTQAAQGCCADADGNGRPDCCDRMGHGQHGAQSGQPAPAGQAPQTHQGH